MKRTPGLQEFIDGFAKKAFGKSHTECKEEKVCTFCHKEIAGFKDSLSRKEYGISGMCQDCQDKAFS